MRLKFVILLFTIGFFGNSLFAQMSPPDFNAIEKAGLIKYNSDKVIRKLKILEDSVKRLVSKHIQTYNQEMGNLLLIYGNTLENLENEFDKNVIIAIQNRDRSQMNGIKGKIEKIIPPIQLEVQKYKDVLNEGLKVLLTEKQYKKWLSY